MKSIIESRYNIAPQDIYQQRMIQQDETKLSEELQNNKNSRVFPKDKIDITGIARLVIQSIDNRQVELTYSIPLKRISADIINKDGSRIEVKNENLPKELKEISDPEVFFAFLRNTYAQVSMLSDGDYKFYINHKLLGGNKEYMFNIIYSINDRIKQRISSKQALENLDINYDKYINVNDSILVTGIRMAQGFISDQYMKDVLYLNDIDRTYFEKTVDEVIYLKQKELIDNNSYELLFSLPNGLEGLKNKIFNKEDPFTIHAVKYFFNSVNSTEASDIDIKEYLKNEKFVGFIYLKLQQQKFIVTFKEFIIQNKPTDLERNNYSMPKNGICHGSCLVSTKLEGNKLIQQHSLTYRDEILQQSSLLQQKYHNMRNPDNKFVFNLFIEKITGVIQTLDNGPPAHLIPKLIQTQNPDFLKFLEEQDIDQGSLYIQSVAILQEKALKENVELQIFTNHDKVLSEEPLTLESFEKILEYLDDKLLNSSSANTKHIILITLEDESNSHDLIIRVDTASNEYISQVIFSDLQDTGLYVVKAISNSKILREASASSVNLIKSYAKNLACNMFKIINAKYIKIGQ